MRLKFLDKDNKINVKSCLIGLSIVAFIFYGLSYLIQLVWNSLNIIHIDYWIAMLSLYIIIVVTGMIIVNVKCVENKRNYIACETNKDYIDNIIIPRIKQLK